MRALFSASFLIIAACSTAPEEQSPVAIDERKPASAAAVAAPERPKMASVELASKPVPQPPGAPAGTLAKRQVFFAYDRFDIADEYRPLLETHARHLRTNPSARMLIQGSADERGSREYNVALGQRRAEAVKKVLVLLGASEAQIEPVSLGEEKPLCRDHAESCWSKNRRGDLLYGGEF